MRNEPSACLRQVWAMKEAAEEETRPCVTAEEYFRHIRSRLPDLRLPEAARAPRPAAAGRLDQGQP
jgi:hypothetical protein